MDTQSPPRLRRSEISDLLTYSQNQRQRTLMVILVTIMLATSLFGAINLFFYESVESAITFFVVSALCLLALWLNWLGYYQVAGLSAAILVLSAAHYNLVDGAGLSDPGIAAYPVIIIIGGLLFGKRTVPLFAIVGITSLITVIYIRSSFTDDVDRLVIVSILILVAAFLTWIIMGNVERNIAQIQKSEIGLRQSYEQTQAQAQQVRQIMETVPEGVLLFDTSGRVVLANQIAQEFLGILAPTYDKNSPLRQLGETSLTDILKVREDRSWQEIKIADPEHIFEVAARPVRHEEDRLQNWVLVLRDITLQRQHQEALHEQERLATVGQLASGIAHDFRNILTVISTYSQILQTKPDTPKRYHYLTVIQSQAQDAAHLIEQILDFSRRSIMESKVTDLVNVVEDLLSLLQRTMPSNITLKFTHEPGQYHLVADKARLQQALMNLAVNARDAMPYGGGLQFALSKELSLKPDLETSTNPWLCLQVTDTGQGITDTDLPRIFEPFYTRKRIDKGTGLGLAQVYGIVKQHGGEITVKSMVGEGTTFYLYFPLISEEPASQIGEVEEQMTLAQEITILLVEDNLFARNSTEEMLKMLGCQVITVDNGKNALNILQTQPTDIDLVISDIVMPEMGGLELYQRLQEIAPDLKMLIMTGYPLDERAKILLEQEVVEWVEKPYQISEIVRKINNILS